MGARGVDVLQVLFLLLVELTEHPLRQDLGEADDGVQRRTELMGHVRQELRLVLAGDFELATLVRDLAEEPGVLDREGGLGRKGPQQIDRPERELARRLPKNGQSADQVAFANKWYGEHRSIPTTAYQGIASRNLCRNVAKVRNLHRLRRLRKAPRRALPL